MTHYPQNFTTWYIVQGYILAKYYGKGGEVAAGGKKTKIKRKGKKLKKGKEKRPKIT